MNLIDRTKPTDDRLERLWTPEQRDRALSHAFAGRSAMPNPHRRWPLAAAACVIVGGLAAAPALVPGWLTPPAAAADLQLLGRSVESRPAQAWSDGQFLRVRSVSTQDSEPMAGSEDVHERISFDDFHAADGWTWSDRVVNGRSERYIFSPSWGWNRPGYAATMPTEPHLLDAFLRARVTGSTSPDEAVFVAVGDMLRQEAAPATVRAAAIGVLGLNPKVTVQKTTDPRGRQALKVTFVDERTRPGMMQFLYLDPVTGLLLGSGNLSDGLRYELVVTDREVVDALPADVARTLGTDKVAKEVIDGRTQTMEEETPVDPTPGPVPTYTVTPQR
ncbi:hypothetical protein [Nigerium massiliense]|uniref:hypothetical protein n=1 Tax=Nigerium massiliense TaxID=1522317 RepID=UPI00059051A1|nr:hypothetical protein [Nigerium massiliense]